MCPSGSIFLLFQNKYFLILDWEDGRCYHDKPRQLSRNALLIDSQMTIEMCKDFCFDKSYLYAGVQWYTQCFCGNKRPSEDSLR